MRLSTLIHADFVVMMMEFRRRSPRKTNRYRLAFQLLLGEYAKTTAAQRKGQPIFQIIVADRDNDLIRLRSFIFIRLLAALHVI